MITAKRLKKDIFCIEGDWNINLKDKTSIRTALDFLQHNANVKYIHRHCSTNGQMEYLLKEYALKRYDNYSILYLSFHGEPNYLKIGRNNILTLEELGDMLEGCLKNKILHFGSCKTLNVSKARINKFLEKTKALAVSGYTKEIDFVPSTFFDMLFFERCQMYMKVTYIESDLKKFYGKVASTLGFKFHYLK